MEAPTPDELNFFSNKALDLELVDVYRKLREEAMEGKTELLVSRLSPAQCKRVEALGLQTIGFIRHRTTLITW